MKEPLAGLISGLLFGFGLALSDMTNTHRVLGFLDLFGDWDPALAFVMGGAVAMTLIGFRFVLRRPHPLLASEFHLPGKRAIDWRLLSGAAVFGIGWGIYGYCPGPAISAIVYGQRDTLLFVAAMVLGMWIASRLPAR